MVDHQTVLDVGFIKLLRSHRTTFLVAVFIFKWLKNLSCATWFVNIEEIFSNIEELYISYKKCEKYFRFFTNFSKENEILQKEKQQKLPETQTELCSPLSIAKQNKMTPILVHICRIWFNLTYTVSDNDFPR